MCVVHELERKTHLPQAGIPPVCLAFASVSVVSGFVESSVGLIVMPSNGQMSGVSRISTKPQESVCKING